MNDQAAFNILASEYDAKFTESLVGKEQRNISRYWLEKLLTGKKNLQIIEINCGTGEDALWLASLGHRVIATDASAAMINEAQKKLTFDSQKNIRFITCEFEELATLFATQKFDLIFSNFAGLNCVPPDKMIFLGRDLHKLLDKDGHLAVVVFGKHTWWETFYYLLKGNPGNAFRRWTNKKRTVRLGEDVHQPVHYYSARKLAKLLSFQLEEKKPVGLFVPPSYLEEGMKKRPKLFNWLLRIDRRAKKLPFASSLADHMYLLFKKEEA
jgi:ubiquinone/menaquinone biosynthesis C-methylase UbiE